MSVSRYPHSGWQSLRVDGSSLFFILVQVMSVKADASVQERVQCILIRETSVSEGLFVYSMVKSRHSPSGLNLFHACLIPSTADKHLVAHLVRENRRLIRSKRKHSFLAYQHTDPTTFRLICSTETSGFFSGASDMVMCVVIVSGVEGGNGEMQGQFYSKQKVT